MQYMVLYSLPPNAQNSITELQPPPPPVHDACILAECKPGPVIETSPNNPYLGIQKKYSVRKRFFVTFSCHWGKDSDSSKTQPMIEF